jgi:predicted transposase/invertase (TIGR01784 family)
LQIRQYREMLLTFCERFLAEIEQLHLRHSHKSFKNILLNYLHREIDGDNLLVYVKQASENLKNVGSKTMTFEQQIRAHEQQIQAQARQEAIQEARQEARQEVSQEMARRMLADGMDRSQIKRLTGLSDEALTKIDLVVN